MKAKNLTIIIAACAFALASCKPKTETTEEQVKSGSTAVEEVVTPAPAVEAPAVEAPAVQEPAVQEPAVEEPAVVAPATPAE